MPRFLHTCVMSCTGFLSPNAFCIVLRLVVSSWFLGLALRLNSVEHSLSLAPLGINSLLHCACCLRTTCLLSAKLARMIRSSRKEDVRKREKINIRKRCQKLTLEAYFIFPNALGCDFQRFNGESARVKI